MARGVKTYLSAPTGALDNLLFSQGEGTKEIFFQSSLAGPSRPHKGKAFLGLLEAGSSRHRVSELF